MNDKKQISSSFSITNYQKPDKKSGFPPTPHRESANLRITEFHHKFDLSDKQIHSGFGVFADNYYICAGLKVPGFLYLMQYEGFLAEFCQIY